MQVALYPLVYEQVIPFKKSKSWEQITHDVHSKTSSEKFVIVPKREVDI